MIPNYTFLNRLAQTPTPKNTTLPSILGFHVVFNTHSKQVYYIAADVISKIIVTTRINKYQTISDYLLFKLTIMVESLRVTK